MIDTIKKYLIENKSDEIEKAKTLIQYNHDDFVKDNKRVFSTNEATLLKTISNDINRLIVQAYAELTKVKLEQGMKVKFDDEVFIFLNSDDENYTFEKESNAGVSIKPKMKKEDLILFTDE